MKGIGVSRVIPEQVEGVLFRIRDNPKISAKLARPSLLTADFTCTGFDLAVKCEVQAICFLTADAFAILT